MRLKQLCGVSSILFATLITLSCSSLRNPLGSETPELFPIPQGGKWGYINRKGEVVIQPQFAQARFFSEGLAVACIERERCGYIDETGKFAINPQFQAAFRFSEGLAAVKVEDKIGYIDKTGKFVINPQFSSEINSDAFSTFSEGLALVKISDKFGFIDKAGKIVINPQFDSAWPFLDGLAAVSIGEPSRLRDEKFGFIDKDGKMVINPQFDFALPFTNGLAIVKIGSQYGYVDKDGKMVINPQFVLALPFSDEGLALVAVATNLEVGFIDKSGKYEVNPQFMPQDQIGRLKSFWEITSDIGRLSFSEGLSPAQVSGGNKGYVDKSGKFVINPQFDSAMPFYGGMAPVGLGRGSDLEMAYIDKEGKFVWREVKEEVRAASNTNSNIAVITNDNSSNNSNSTQSATTNSNTSTANSSSNQRTGRLTTDTNLRSEPNKDTASLGIHFRGAKVRILDETSYERDGEISTWYKVRVYDYGCSNNANLGCGKNTPNDADEGWVNAKNVLLN